MMFQYGALNKHVWDNVGGASEQMFFALEYNIFAGVRQCSRIWWVFIKANDAQENNFNQLIVNGHEQPS